ncbi:MAG: lamin tail domain-containing protein, partial [Thermoanaerobaculia bacterium]|nr:lamin tail domain-containing protein [Thermoanaerobaculia bacterium]
ILGNFRFDLGNKSGKIALYDPAGKPVHSVRYTDSRPWPPLADGLGASVELAAGREGNLPTDWRESYVLSGTPGRPNSLPPDVSGLFVNEILASNTKTLPDEQGEYDDWFELYNGSDDSLNIGGLCFTDDDEEPCKWQAPLHFPATTTIPPHGFLLLWADDQSEQGPLHAGFRLSAGGEIVVVYQRAEEDYAEVERLSFGQQSPDVSWGRYPDGSASIAFMHPTPGATNLLTGTDDPSGQPLRMFPNPFSQRLYIDAAKVEKPYRLRLFNTLGQAVFTADNQWQETAVLQREGFPAGIYSLLLLDARGRRFIGKVVME